MNFWQGEKVRLRGIEPSDWEFFAELNMDSDLARHLHFVWPPEAKESVMAWALEKSKKKLENDAYFWVVSNEQGKAVGAINTHHCDHRIGSFSYAIDIAAEHRRKGYASEAIKIVLIYYFEELRYQKVNVDVHSNNPASISLHEKLGFQKEGVHRRMVYTDGKFHDEIWFGMTKEEFKAKIGKSD